MIVYGWVEQNGCSWGIETLEIDDEENKNIDPDDGQVMGVLHEGSWFDTFAHAKAAAIKFWEDEVHTARLALSEIRKLRKKDIA